VKTRPPRRVAAIKGWRRGRTIGESEQGVNEPAAEDDAGAVTSSRHDSEPRPRSAGGPREGASGLSGRSAFLAHDSSGRLSGRKPRNRGCRTLSRAVHSVKPIWATSFGSSQCTPGAAGDRRRTATPMSPAARVSDPGAARCHGRTRCRPCRRRPACRHGRTRPAKLRNRCARLAGRCSRRSRTPARAGT
jgi:hypothetical protein